MHDLTHSGAGTPQVFFPFFFHLNGICFIVECTLWAYFVVGKICVVFGDGLVYALVVDSCGELW